jgi:hypothetical protein
MCSSASELSIAKLMPRISDVTDRFFTSAAGRPLPSPVVTDAALEFACHFLQLQMQPSVLFQLNDAENYGPSVTAGFASDLIEIGV